MSRWTIDEWSAACILSPDASSVPLGLRDNVNVLIADNRELSCFCHATRPRLGRPGHDSHLSPASGDDVNPRFFELEGTLIYPYTMQDHLSRTKEDKSYRALFLAGRHDPTLSVAFRNLGMTAWKRDKALDEAARWLEKAIEARPTDQVSHRDLAHVLIALGRHVDAIHLLHNMPAEPARRGDVTTLLARAYLAERRYDQALEVLDTATYSNWEGDIDNWLVFVGAHIERGIARLVSGDAGAALDDFDAALTYPEHLHVGRSSKPREARAQYWRGSALAMLGRLDEARAAWQAGAEGQGGFPEQDECIERCRAELGRNEE